MAKPIKILPESIEKIVEDFKSYLKSANLTDGRVSFSKSMDTVSSRARVFFTPEAWIKMQTLVSSFDKEIAWHGCAKRGDNPREYIVYDILVYPQAVTGASVTTDQSKYELWLMSQEDEVFDNLRFQGHSHVSMGTSPSSVDLASNEKIVEQLTGDMFYIFMIWNKKGEHTAKVYDLKENTLFETADVDVSVSTECDLAAFLKEAKSLVQDTPYRPATVSAPKPGKVEQPSAFKQSAWTPKPKDREPSRPVSRYADDDYTFSRYGGYGYGYFADRDF